MGRKFLVGGNWKMNGSAALVEETAAKTLAGLPDTLKVVVAPPFPYLIPLKQALLQHGVRLASVAAQNVHEKVSGAVTGEVGVAILQEVGVDWVIIGHSERRVLLGESPTRIRDKLASVLQNSVTMRSIVCVGESEQQYEEGVTLEVLRTQLDALIEIDPTDGRATRNVAAQWLARVVLAYEPVWAIGTGKAASPAEVQKCHALIRDWIREKIGAPAAEGVRIIYGGSVNAENCAELSCLPDVDGFLVGGASIQRAFRSIVLAGANK